MAKRVNDDYDDNDDYHHDDSLGLAHYYLVIDRKLWGTFKAVASLMGLKIKDAVVYAIAEWIQKYGSSQTRVEVKIIENREAKENLLQIITEEEIRDLLRELMAAKQRKANSTYIESLKHRLFELLRKTPVVSSELAHEIKITLQNLRG